MDDKEEIIVGHLNPHSANALKLLQVKNAYIKGVEALNLEISEKRQYLANKLLRTKKLSYKMGRKFAYRAVEKELHELIKSAKTHYEQTLQQSQNDCLELAVKIAEEIIQTEVRSNTEILANKIKSSVEKLISPEDLVIQANPVHISELKSIFINYPKKIKFESNETLEAGNVNILSSSGELHINWRTQLEVIHDLLTTKIKSISNEQQ